MVEERLVARRCALYALLATALFAGWQQLTVARNYGGNWTALFCTGSVQPVPPSLLAGTYRVSSLTGFDGQMYRYVAHDPFLTGEPHHYLDNTALRTRRILVPGLAWLLALGHWPLIDWTYILLFWLTCFAGTYWTGRVLHAKGIHPAWSLLFALLPASLIAADRLVIDMASCALLAGVIYAHTQHRTRLLIVLLALGCLCRETGFLFLAGFLASAFANRQWRRALSFAIGALPALAWYAFVAYQLRHAPPGPEGAVPAWLGSVRTVGPWLLLTRPADYPFSPIINALAQRLDQLAILGTLLAVALGFMFWTRNPRQPLNLNALLLSLSFAATLSPTVWVSSYNYLRVYSPLFLTLALCATKPALRSLLWLSPCALAIPRILLQLAPQMLGVFGHRANVH